MRRFALVFVTLGCQRHETAISGDEAAAKPSAPIVSIPAPTPTVPAALASAFAAATNDFEDLFAYGGPVDAGAVDPTLLTKKPGYAPYANGRFSFIVDVPKALTAMPEPTNGDGMQWRLGGLVAMNASGMFALDMPASCASGPNVTAHTETATTCWATGKRGGFIFWEKTVIDHDTRFSLRFQYAESLKTAMDPIVTHVNASWKY